MDKFAHALINLRGLSVTQTEAATILELYQGLHDYDKKPLVFSTPRTLQSPRGRFARSKGRAQSIIGLDHMKKYEYAHYYCFKVVAESSLFQVFPFRRKSSNFSIKEQGG